MKKASLAIALLATLGSSAAFADVEGDNVGSITIGGQITAPAPFKWVSAIDKNPAKLNSTSPKQVTDWVSANGGASSSMDLGLNEETPATLVTVHTQGLASTNTLLPSITFTDGSGKNFDATTLVNAATHPLSLKVSMGQAHNSLVETSDTSAVVTIEFMGAGEFSKALGDNPVYRVTTPSYNAPSSRVLAKQAAEFGMHVGSSFANMDTTFSKDWQAVVSGNTDYKHTATLVGMVAATGAKLVTTAATKPAGYWQASLPVTVAYK